MGNDLYEFKGRGLGTGCQHDPCNIIECDHGTVLVIIVAYGGAEFVHGYCRKAVIDRWHLYCCDPFRRASDSTLTLSWPEPMGGGLFLYRPARLDIMAEQPWMWQHG